MASKGVNKVIIIGNCGKDPEIRTFDNGGMLVNTTIATSESWKDKSTGQMVDRTEWHKVVFNGKLAEIAGNYIKKGSKLYIEGKLKTRKWKDKEGIERYITEVVADNLQMLDSKADGIIPAKEEPKPNNQLAFGEFDDDIPF